MHCGSCAVGIQMILSATPGVSSANVSYDTKLGDVEFDDLTVNVEQIQKAVADLGYKATPQ